jgi:serine/threonine-protein kinase
VYGLGTYADGRPFYAMRFIKGDNLKQAIERFHGGPGSAATGRGRFESIEFRQLLQRFVDVCNAVAYAHSRGVLHRDLKPGNIMLGKYGETLVVDWGLAKPTGRGDAKVADRDDEATLQPRSGGDSSSATAMGETLGTPAYMSPEQAAGRLDELGPASDVYSLGATMYELLTGRPPFKQVDLDAVRKGSFPAPRQLNQRLPRALEAVCLKGMALRPADRYESALGLAKDVERWLADEPVTCWRESAGARLRRWVRKHSRLVAGLAAAVLVAAAGFGLLAFERERAREALASKEAETARERDVAREQKRRTRAALDTMVSEGMVERLGAQKAITKSQREFLRVALGYYREFAAEAATDEEGRSLEAHANFRVAYLLAALGQSEDALSAYRRAVAAYEKLAADFPAVPVYRTGLANSHNNRGNLLVSLGRRAPAEADYRAALAVWSNLVADYPAVPGYRGALASVHNALGMLLADLGQPTTAEAEYRAALAIWSKLAADFPAVSDHGNEIARSHHNLGLLLAGTGRPSAAEAEYRAALAMWQKLAADFPAAPRYRSDVAQSHNNLGNLLADTGRQAAAGREYRAALAIVEALATEFPAVPGYRNDLAVSHNNLGTLLAALGQRTAAQREYRAGLSAWERLAAEFPAVVDYAVGIGGGYANLGDLLRDSGDPAAALTLHNRSVDRLTPIVAAQPRLVEVRQFLGKSHVGRAKDYVRLKRFPEALADWEVALRFADGSDRLGIRAGRACCLARLGRATDAAREAGAVAADPAATADVVYDCACAASLASAVPGNAVAAAHAAEAVELLRQSVARGYADTSNLLADADLASLRKRPDYADLLWDIADTLAPAAPEPR